MLIFYWEFFPPLCPWEILVNHSLYWYCLCLFLISGQCWPHKITWEVFLSLLFSGRNCVDVVLFAILKGLIEFTSKTIWARKILLGEIFHWKFNLVNRYRRIQVIYSILDEFEKFLVFLELVFHRSCKIYVCSLFIVFHDYYPFMEGL